MRPARLSLDRHSPAQPEPARPELGVVLVAHGSRDPRAGVATAALARAVGRAHPSWAVRAAYLDHAGPRPLDVLSSLPVGRAVVVPLLLTSAYHGRVDIPAVLASAASLPLTVSLAPVLGPEPDRGPRSDAGSAAVSPLLVDGLVRQLPVAELDAVVLAAAGTRDAAARATVEDVGNALSARLRLPCTVAYASAAPPSPGEAIERLKAAGARRIGMAAYFLAPGLLYDNAVRSAAEAGAIAVAEPLRDAPELVQLVGVRVAHAVRSTLAPAA